jgi:hypothetical protein
MAENICPILRCHINDESESLVQIVQSYFRILTESETYVAR